MRSDLETKEVWRELNLDNKLDELIEMREEGEWIRKLRRRALKYFYKNVHKNEDLKRIAGYIKKGAKFNPLPKKIKGEEVPEEIKKIYDALNIGEVEKRVLSGYYMQKDTEVVKKNIAQYLEKKGVMFDSLTDAVNKEEKAKIIKRYLGKVINYKRNPKAALNIAFMQGGSFMYVPKNVSIPLPIIAFFTITQPYESQFEHTLLVVDKNSELYFVEGCVAPIYRSYSFHMGVVEGMVKRKGKLRIVTLQNWSKNIINLPEKKIRMEENANLEWVELVLGGKISRTIPYIDMIGKRGKAIFNTASLTSPHQTHISGANIRVHKRKSRVSIKSKAIVMEKGSNVYEGEIKMLPDAHESIGIGECDGMFLGNGEIITKPKSNDLSQNSLLTHEAKTTLINESTLTYLMNRGFDKEESIKMLSLGFVEDVLQNLPLDVIIEFKKLIEMEIEGGVG